ncbi:MAG: GDSL-type esterase/lipase family protein [Nocardioidaceae bacterium]|nr:GDSL-type esterase/lipase family protein [Nocardioidaceae bacterium]
MPRRPGLLVPLLLSAMVGAATLTGASVSAATPPVAPAPVRVLVNGDSISQGADGDWTWRYRLDREADRQGVDLDLVGSKTATFAGLGRYADPEFDRDHFATWGTTLAVQTALIEDEVRAQTPDVVILAAGIVDLSTRTPAEVEVTLREWIANVRAAAPTVRILISPTLARSEFVTPQVVAQFAARERAVAAELSTPGSPITVADTDRGWSFRAFTWDGTHPLCVGENWIGQKIGEELVDVGVLERRPAIFGRRCVTPAPTVQVGSIAFTDTQVSWTRAPRTETFRVRYRVGTSTRWLTRTLRDPLLRVRGVQQVEVTPVNRQGQGPVRVATRPAA